MKKSFFFLVFLATHFCLNAQTTLIPYGSVWKYLDNGTNQGTAWRTSTFDDAIWKSGAAQLGYGQNDEATLVNYGTSTSNKYITTYFRKTIAIANPAVFATIVGNIKRDDGAVIYVNGTEVFRSNLATGTITSTTLASNASDNGNTAQAFSVAPSLLVSGNNYIAVEIHQTTLSSSDVSFDLELKGNIAVPSPTFLPYGSVWKYLDNGTNQGTAWRTTTFDDATWKSGAAQLGYGDNDEATRVSYGTSTTNKYITTYFRKTVSVTNPTAFATILGNVKRDDGAVIYVNGTEVFRSNLATGTITSTTLASNASDNGNTPQAFSFAPSLLVSGNNYIAVEIHQTSISSSDISFDLELKGNDANLTRGPYMNMGNQTAVTLRWRSDIPTNTKVEVGTTYGSYPTAFSNATLATDHEIRLTGLTPDTKYYYRFGSTTKILQAGTDNYFVTAPPATSTRKMRFAVFGDCGINSASYQTLTLAAYQSYLGSNTPEVMVLLGDNAYSNGTDAEYQTGFFAPYQSSILKNHIIMPTPGNHDYANSSTQQKVRTGAYYQNFTMPTAAECGGVASGTEGYYSWDRGDVHFLSLDSYGTESANNYRLYDTLTSPQVAWIKQDLAANTKKWTIAYWHHPPYTMGSHNSDTETDLVNMRNRLIRILERYGVDLILCGHSHDYERSYLLKGHYGLEASFNLNTHAVSNSSAKYNGTSNSCPYKLPNGQVNHGIVYVVAGSAGASGSTQAGYPHNALPFAFNDGGMLSLEIEGNRLDAKFIRKDQVIADQFTIMKDVNKTTNMTIAAGASPSLKASWLGNYTWNTGATTQSITVAPMTNTTYTVTDNLSCLTDVFNITIQTVLPFGLTSSQKPSQFKVFPNPVEGILNIQFEAKKEQNTTVELFDYLGRQVLVHPFTSQAGSNQLSFPTQEFPTGLYSLKIKYDNKEVVEKIIIR